MKEILLLDSQIEKLTNLPETGMGYQVVNIALNNGEVKNNITILNCELLQLEDGRSRY